MREQFLSIRKIFVYRIGCNLKFDINRNFFLIEKDDTYFQDMKKRFNLDNQNNIEFIENLI